jgi:hypothetical protein
MPIRRRLLAAQTALLVALACRSGTEVGEINDALPKVFPAPEPGIFRTDATGYYVKKVGEIYPGVSNYELTIVTRYRNPTADTIFLVTCFPDAPHPVYGFYIAGTNSGGGITYNQAWGCVEHDRHIAVAPGATRTDTMRFRGPNALDGATHQPLDPTVTGNFQIRYGPRSCRTFLIPPCSINADSLSSSNPFTVVLQP